MDSLLKLELVLFLHQNPDTLDSADGLSMRIGYGTDRVVSALPDLVQTGLVVQHGEGDTAVYRYTDDRGLRDVVEGNYNSVYGSREERRLLQTRVTARSEAG
jgi:hypothetical protein